MTDAPFPSDDELVSAYLDGEATPDERARVEADPALLARVEVFRQAGAALGPAPRPPVGAADAAVAVALAHAAAVLPPPGQASVVPLAGRTRPRQMPPMLVALGAAAALVVILGVVGVVLRRSGSSTIQTASAPAGQTTSTATGGGAPRPAVGAEHTTDAAGATPPAPSSTTTAAGATSANGDPSSTRPATTSTTGTTGNGGAGSPEPGGAVATEASDTYTGDDLGTLASPGAVREAVARRLAAGAAPPTTPLTTAPPTTTPGQPVSTTIPPPSTTAGGTRAVATRIAGCDATVRAADAELGALRYSATATFSGSPALVLLYAIAPHVGNANGPNRIYVVAFDPACAVLDVQTF